MTQPEIQRVVIIGAGKLAWHLGYHLSQKGIKIVQVFSRSKERGENLSKRVGADYIDSLDILADNADLYILAVTDQVIDQIAGLLSVKNKLIVHTSGAIDMKVFERRFQNFGVFYPLQTFSFQQDIDFLDIPVCLEANSPENLERLRDLALKLSRKVFEVDSDQRRNLHLAAVFACNFSNFMYVIASEILHRDNLSMELLEPLIRQTNQLPPDYDFFAKQTGPAVRSDESVIRNHLKLLADYPGYQEIYKTITQNIINYKSAHGEL